MDNELPPTADPSLLTPIAKLTKDLREASRTLGKAEAKFLTDQYYVVQENRIRAAHQLRTLAAETEDKPSEPHDVIAWLQLQESTLEEQIKRALHQYAISDPVGIWALSIVGIGPVITAGLLSNIFVGDWCSVCHAHSEEEHWVRRATHGDHKWAPMDSCPTVGHIWRFAGLDPTTKWESGQKRPWNASLKRLCWLIGESFTKVSNHQNDIYGKIYKERKEREVARNEAGKFAEQARISLETKSWRRDTVTRAAYEAGKLPPARVHLRAQRVAVKRFLSDLHCVWYFQHYQRLPPKPWIITHGGHVHYVEPPNTQLVYGLSEALRGRAA